MRTPLSLAALVVVAVACNPAAVGLPFPTGDVPAGSDRPALADATDVPMDVPADVPADASVACASSRMCPGQVCDVTLGRCVDCVAHLGCTGGLVCTRNRCAPPPTPCRSDRECGAFNQVCDASRGQCVDCISDVDCPGGQFCTAERACVAQVCVPAARDCASLRELRVCSANGSVACTLSAPPTP